MTPKNESSRSASAEERIQNLLRNNDFLPHKVIEQIKLAELSAYQRGLKDGDSCTAKSMEIAREAGLEEAAKMVETFTVTVSDETSKKALEYSVPHGKYIAARIRNLKSEGK